MKQNILIAVLISALCAVLTSTVLVGCVSQHKLTQPSGRWQSINQVGFVPADAERFYKAVVQQAAAEVAAEVAAENSVNVEPVSNQAQVSEFGHLAN